MRPVLYRFYLSLFAASFLLTAIFGYNLYQSLSDTLRERNRYREHLQFRVDQIQKNAEHDDPLVQKGRLGAATDCLREFDSLPTWQYLNTCGYIYEIEASWDYKPSEIRYDEKNIVLYSLLILAPLWIFAFKHWVVWLIKGRQR